MTTADLLLADRGLADRERRQTRAAVTGAFYVAKFRATLSRGLPVNLGETLDGLFPEEPARQSPGEMLRIVEMLNAAFGGSDLRPAGRKG